MKNQQKMHKRIVRVILLSLSLCVMFGFKVVHAGGGNCKKTQGYPNYITTSESSVLKKRYGMYIDVSDRASDSYTVYMECGCDCSSSKLSQQEKEKCETTFYIDSINDVVQTGEQKTVTCSKPATFSSGTTNNTNTATTGIKVRLIGHNIRKNEKDSESCFYEDAQVELEKTFPQSITLNSSTCSPPDGFTPPSHMTQKIVCKSDDSSVNYDNYDIFQIKFCEAKDGAKASGNYYCDGSLAENAGKNCKSLSSLNSTKTFKCNHKLCGDGALELGYQDNTGEEYFTSSNGGHGYLYAEKKYIEDSGEAYVYEYSPGYKETVPIKCEVTCQEAVKVEYGPPVAAYAGMCFEYKVRVTSRVSCTSKEIDQPSANTGYVTPGPWCEGYEGRYRQGGPNEAFDACINACDGGKYSKKCSNKCYKQVYGSNITASAKVKNSSLDLDATKLVNNDVDIEKALEECLALPENYTGCYYLQDGEINWRNSYRPEFLSFNNGQRYRSAPAGSYVQVGFLGDEGNEGRWYKENGTTGSRWYAESGHRFFLNQGDGFWRKLHSDGGYCQDDCEWSLDYCDSNNCYLCKTSNICYRCDANKKNCNPVYINPGYGCRDYQNNLVSWKKAVQACDNKTTCKTETAEFTIDVNYKNLANEEKKISFPINGNPDYVNKDGHSSGKTSTLFPNYPVSQPSIDSGLAGCYGKDKNTNLYRVTWGFPGSWINWKSNEVSYEQIDGDGWEKFPERFCLPGDAKTVNAVWWNAYYYRLALVEWKNQMIHLSITDAVGSNTYREKCIYYASDLNNNSLYNRDYSFYSSECKYNVSEDDITYNIHAHAKKFGYFGWNINADCFYAINDDPYSDPRKYEKSGEQKDGWEYCISSPNNYRIRTVDLKNMFPDPDGDELTDSSKTGRLAGFNWSYLARSVNNHEYSSDPTKIIKRIQESADPTKNGGVEVYSDQNLDYQFVLTPSTLRRMRKDYFGDSANSNYTAFDDSGFNVEDNGVARYYSKLIHGTTSSGFTISKDDKKVPVNSWKCNDMINYKSDDCMYYGG